jgi:hypothetical protein
MSIFAQHEEFSTSKLKIMEEKEKEKFWYEAGSFITKKGIKVTLYREVK